MSNREQLVRTLAEDLYAIYGATRQWKRSEGKPMEEDFSALPDTCQAAWKAVAKEAILQSSYLCENS